MAAGPEILSEKEKKKIIDICKNPFEDVDILDFSTDEMQDFCIDLTKNLNSINKKGDYNDDAKFSALQRFILEKSFDISDRNLDDFMNDKDKVKKFNTFSKELNSKLKSELGIVASNDRPYTLKDHKNNLRPPRSQYQHR